jgi:hypothetical protein
MDHDKKLAWIHKMTKMGLEHTALPEIQHLDDGGTVLGGPVSSTGAPGATTTAGGFVGPINSAIGLNNGFQGQSANITPGTNTAQLNDAYTGAQSGLTQQQNLTNTLTPGVAQGAAAQSALSGTLANEAAGKGPNPAQAALNQSTGQNIAQTAALIAGQRGAGANAGAAAAAAANAGAATQQGAVGQSATLQAQQQLAAQQEQASLAATQVGQGANAVTGVNQVQQNEQNILQGANTSANNAAVAQQSNINSVNSQTAAANQNMAGTTFGGILGGLSSGLSGAAAAFAKGGLVKMDKGGNVLDANARKHIAPDNFALPGRRYPIHDIEHARNALARVSQNGTPAEKAKVKSAVHKKYPSLAGKGPKKMADGGDVGNDNNVEFQPTASDTSSGPSVAAAAPLPAFTPKSGSSSGGSSPTSGLSSLAGGASGVGSGGAGGASAGGASGAAASAAPLAALALAGGGFIAPQSLAPQRTNGNGPQSFAGQWVNTTSNVSSGPQVSGVGALPQFTHKQSTPAPAKKADTGNSTPAMTPDEAMQGPDQQYDSLPSTPAAGSAESFGLDPSLDQNSSPAPTPQNDYRGGLAATGGKVPAGKNQQAVVKGDSLKNDKIPTMLSEGEIVIPRHITQSANAGDKAKKFVESTLARRKK